MRTTLIALFVTIVGGSALLYIEYCWFGHDCPISWPTAGENQAPENQPASETSEEQASAQAFEPFTFKIKYLSRPKGEEDFQPLGNDSVLYAGSHYKLIFEPTENSYVYIFRIDSDNKISRLFPPVKPKRAAKANQNPVQKGVTYFVPAERKSFRLNKQPGKETIYFVATQQPDATLEGQYQLMLAAQKARSFEERLAARQEWDTAMESRGFAPELVADETQNTPLTWKEKKQQFSVMPQYLKGMCDKCVHMVSFQHR